MTTDNKKEKDLTTNIKSSQELTSADSKKNALIQSSFFPKSNENKTLSVNNGSEAKRLNPYENKRFNKWIPEFEERVVEISRVTNVVKGGRRFSFSVLVVIGNKKGKVGYGQGKAKEIPEAIKKAIKKARKNLINVPIVKGITIPHVTQAKFVSSKVFLKPTSKGSGIIASGAIRPVIELAGYHDIVTKSLGSSNKKNVVKATLKALSTLKIREEILNLKK